jgi:hypothetical protein
LNRLIGGKCFITPFIGVFSCGGTGQYNGYNRAYREAQAGSHSVRTDDFHSDKRISVFHHLAVDRKAAAGKTFLSTDIPVERFQIDSMQFGLGENVIYCGEHCIASIPLSPVCFVTDHDTDFRFFSLFVDIEETTVADMSAVMRFDGEVAVSVTETQDIREVFEVFFERIGKWLSCIVAAQLGVGSPAVIVNCIGDLFGAQSDFLAGQ